MEFQWASVVTMRKKGSDVTDPVKEPLFTVKELLFGVALCTVYTALLLSMDPEWIGWAAPLVFGGALAASGPPPVPVFSASPREVLQMASSMSLFSLLALGLLIAVRGEHGIGWFARARQSFETALLRLGTRVLLLSLGPDVALNFIRVLSKRLARVEKGLAESNHTWSCHGLAKVLLHLSDQYGEEVPAGRELVRKRE